MVPNQWFPVRTKHVKPYSQSNYIQTMKINKIHLSCFIFYPALLLNQTITLTGNALNVLSICFTSVDGW